MFVETNQLFGSNPHVILTRQICGQRLGMAVGSKRRALAFYSFILICYMFSLSKCREESENLVCAWLQDLQKKCRCAVANSDKSCGQTRFKIGSRHCAAAFPLKVPKSFTDLDPTNFYILILGTYSKFVHENEKANARRLPPAAMPERCPQVCCIKIKFELLLTICFVSTAANSMKCLVNWILRNMHVCFEQNPTLP